MPVIIEEVLLRCSITKEILQSFDSVFAASKSLGIHSRAIYNAADLYRRNGKTEKDTYFEFIYRDKTQRKKMGARFEYRKPTKRGARFEYRKPTKRNPEEYMNKAVFHVGNPNIQTYYGCLLKNAKPTCAIRSNKKVAKERDSMEKYINKGDFEGLYKLLKQKSLQEAK